MDPLTALLQLLNTLARNYGQMLEGASPDTRAEFARLQLDREKEWCAAVNAVTAFLKK